MVVYYIALTSIFLLLLFTYRNKAVKNVGLFISFLILWLISGFRDVSVGLDTVSYVAFFNSVKDGSIDVLNQVSIWNLFSVNGFESGYKLYNYVLSLFINGYTPFLLITYAFIYYSIYRLIKKYSTNYLVSTTIYISLFYFFSMNQLRQAFAASILAWGVKYIFERNFKKYLIIVLLATLVHQASIILIIPYFMYNKKLSAQMIAVYSVVALFVFAAIGPIVRLLASGNARYEVYVGDIGVFEIGNLITFGVYALLTVVIAHISRKNIFATELKGKELQEVITKKAFYLKMLLISVLISLLSIQVSSLNRLAPFFMMFSIVAIPFLLSKSSGKRLNSLALILCLALLLFRFATLLLKPEWLGVSEYHFTMDF